MGPVKRGRDLSAGAGAVKATRPGRSCYAEAMAKAPAPVPEYDAALARLRAFCADWPGVTETTSWGNPTFKAAGKSFAVLDRYKGDYCIWLRCDPAGREDL